MASPNSPGPSKAERRAAAQQQAQTLREEQERRERRQRTVLVSVIVGLIAVVAVAVTLIVAEGSRAPLDRVTAPTGANSAGGIVVGAEGVGRPTEGAPEVQVYSDFICPYCALFEQVNGGLLDELRTSGQANVVYHPVAFLDDYSQGTRYSSRAAQAAAVVADSAPEQFVPFHAALFASQPAENTPGLTDEQIADLAIGVGVPQAVVDTFGEGVFDEWVRAASDQAGRDLPRPATPTIVIDGEVFDGDWRDPEVLRAAITG